MHVSGAGEVLSFPNSRKYRDSSLPNAVGRAGSATVTTRALLAKDGQTTLEVTTGDLEAGAAAPGSLETVQVKALDPADEQAALWTLNYRRPGAGYASYRVGGLAWGRKLQVQSTVRGIDPNRSDVVTVVEAVKLAPDLAVEEVEAPQTVVTHRPVDIVALVQERNGDVGARVDCVLAVDGAEVDRAEGIWVDTYSIVGCSFTHRFDAVGRRLLTVRLEGAAPADWDTQNDARSRWINVKDAATYRQDFLYAASVAQEEGSINGGTSYHLSYSSRGGSRTHEIEFTSSRRWHLLEAGHWGQVQTEIQFPIGRVQLTHESNGATLGSISEENVAKEWDGDYNDGSFRDRYACADRMTRTAEAGVTYLQVCAGAFTFDGAAYYPYTNFQSYRQAGEVTYRSRGYERWRERLPDGTEHEYYYDLNSDGSEDYGGRPLPPLGKTYTSTVTLTTAGGRAYTSVAEMWLEPLNYSDSRPYTCDDLTWSSGDYSQTGASCHWGERRITGLAGQAFGQPTTVP